MTDAGSGQPAVDEPPHPVPEHATVLAAARQLPRGEQSTEGIPDDHDPHDSGSVWVVNPSPYDSFIHYTSPV